MLRRQIFVRSSAWLTQSRHFLPHRTNSNTLTKFVAQPCLTLRRSFATRLNTPLVDLARANSPARVAETLNKLLRLTTPPTPVDEPANLESKEEVAFGEQVNMLVLEGCLDWVLLLLQSSQDHTTAHMCICVLDNFAEISAHGRISLPLDKALVDKGAITAICDAATAPVAFEQGREITAIASGLDFARTSVHLLSYLVDASRRFSDLSLDEWLQVNNLEDSEESLKSLGVAKVQDILLVDQKDLASLKLAPILERKLWNAIRELKATRHQTLSEEQIESYTQVLLPTMIALENHANDNELVYSCATILSCVLTRPGGLEAFLEQDLNLRLFFVLQHHPNNNPVMFFVSTMLAQVAEVCPQHL
eukprot:c19347_g2_i3.p1 GENE.c19347_g2_i3~~c19347_g2_i3.p1  ORF type:complete len:363 (-),score=78.50 c19347_g2_i3:1727-2815(-)